MGSTDTGLHRIRQAASTGAQSDLMDSTRWGWSCMLQLQEMDTWGKPATTTWAAEFLLRDGESREFLGSWINSSAVHEAKKRRAKQVITCSFPCGKWLHKIGARMNQDVNSAKEKGERTWHRLPPSQWKQWRTFKAPDVKRRRKVSLALTIGAGGI